MTKASEIEAGDQIVLTVKVDVTDVAHIDNGTTEIYFSAPYAITVNNDMDITKVEPT